MARKKRILGETFGQEIMKRGSDLQQKQASHGDVFSGELADQALGAIGARAMTMDGEIIVNSNFDLSNAEDQSLYAHELYHQARSGGAAGNAIRDAEEIAARTIEAMVFHRAGGGRSDALPTNIEDLFQEAETPAAPAQAGDREPTTDPVKAKKEGTPSAVTGYAALRRQGMTHQEVIYMMTQMLLKEHDEHDEHQRQRGGKGRGFSF